MYNFTCNLPFIHVFIELVVSYIMYKTKNIYKFTFYMKLMTASCSMSKFLPIVTIFRQIITPEIYIYMYVSFDMFINVISHVIQYVYFN